MVRVIKFLSSLKLAVLVILSLSAVSAVGTFVESRYDSEAAIKLVYDTPWLWTILLVLAVNLIAVMVDRWPWQKRHIPFLFAHVGILLILSGSYMTKKWGIDGNMRVEIGKSNQYVVLSETEVSLYQSTDGAQFFKVFQQEVDFFSHRPSVSVPFVVPAPEANIAIVDYKPYVIPQKKILPSSEPTAGAAVRFQLQNKNVSQIEWLVQEHASASDSKEMGLMKIYLTHQPPEGRGENEVFLKPLGQEIAYIIFKKESLKPWKQGIIKEGESVPLGWMGLELKILRYMDMAELTWEIQERDRPTPLTTAAIKVRDQDKERWLMVNDTIRTLRTGSLLRFIYAQKRLPLQWPVFLKNFEVEKYEGTQKASAYKSQVEVPGFGQHLISMNEPMKLSGLLFYQASFEDGPRGQPVASIFSVNYDPGRWVKYLGSLIMSLGIILLFYFKKFYQKKNI